MGLYLYYITREHQEQQQKLCYTVDNGNEPQHFRQQQQQQQQQQSPLNSQVLGKKQRVKCFLYTEQNN